MKERPILFSGPMVRALMAGTKTQTRRVCKPANAAALSHVVECPYAQWGDEDGDVLFKSPYGVYGDRLYVRETWAAPHAYDHLPPRLIPKGARIHYAATEERGGLLWRPSIHMPRWASRITLEVTSVRVERLQDISESDAMAEGAPSYEEGVDAPPPDADYEWSYRASFIKLWESINGPGSWDLNPWVWVVEFSKEPINRERHDPPVED